MLHVVSLLEKRWAMVERIVLVNPDSLDLYSRFNTRTLQKVEAQIPLGLCYIAAVLEADNYDVSIIDNYVYNLATDELSRIILDKNPAYAGFYSSSMNFTNALSCARLLKRSHPAIKVVFGGPHVCAKTIESIRYDCIDYIIKGEGEFLFRDLVRSGGKLSCPGIISKNNCKKKLFEHNIYHKVEDLDTLPMPARHLVVMDMYPRKEDAFPWPMDIISTSRGCPYHCRFCSTLSKSSYRFRTAEKVVAEILFLKRHYNTKALYFREDNFTADPQRVEELCRLMIEKGAALPFQCEVRSNSITPKLIDVMKKAGCKRVWFGAESGCQHILNMINKGATLKHSKEAVQNCKNAGIRIGAAFVIGFPGETKSDIHETFRFACDLNADEAWFQAYVAYPGSEMYKDALQKGLVGQCFNGIGFIETDQFLFEDIIAYEKKFNREYIALNKKSTKKVVKQRRVFDIRFKSVADYQALLSLIIKEKHKNIILYGASHGAVMVNKALARMGKKILGVIDGNKDIHGSYIIGHSVKGRDAIVAMKPDVVLICSSGYQNEIYAQLKYLKKEGIDVLKIYDSYFSKPEDVSVMITGRCPLRCMHCDSWKKYDKHIELNIKELNDLFQDIYNTGCRAINITGGEPFVRDDLFEILHIIQDCGFIDVTLNTNGFYLNEEKIKELKKYHIKNIGISIDGDSEVHNKIRRHYRAYEKAVNAVDLCVDYGFPVTLAMVLTRFNYNKIFHVLDIAGKKGCKAVLQPALKTLHYSSESIGEIEIRDEIPALKKEVDKIKYHKHRHVLNNSNEHLDMIVEYLADPQSVNIPCHVGYHRSHIMPDGAVMACLAMGKIGNIRHECFSNLWYSAKYDRIRDKMMKGKCPKCMLNCYMSHNLSHKELQHV